LGSGKFIVQSDNMQVIETMMDGGFTATSSAANFLVIAGF
jgi:hypothetical protein